MLFDDMEARGNNGGRTRSSNCVAEYTPADNEPVVRCEMPTDQQMQVGVTTISPTRVELKAFVATLGYSRATHERFSDYERQGDRTTGLTAALGALVAF